MKYLNILGMGLVLSLGVTPPGIAADSLQPGPSAEPVAERTIRGDVLMIEGPHYFVKDTSGHEVRLHVNGQTKMEDRIKVGDKIESRVSSDGHAISIMLYAPQNVAAPFHPSAASPSAGQAAAGQMSH